MSFGEREKARLRMLVAESMSQNLTLEDCERLKELLRASQEARQYYIELLGVYTDLQDLVGSRCRYNPSQDIQVKPSSSRRWQLLTLVSVAAIVVFALLGNWSLRPSGPEIATLVDTIEAQGNWLFPRQHDRLHASKKNFHLRKGGISIHYDQGVDVTLEGDCSFQLISDHVLVLHSGRVFAHVGENAQGFTILTRNAKIVDLGTEFGVIAYKHGDTELHVMRGKVEVCPTGPLLSNSHIVRQGQAQRITDGGRQVQSIVYNDKAFARQVRSRQQFIWRGQMELDLADVIAGGNGLGTGKDGYEINPLTGEFQIIKRDFCDRHGNHTYHPVSALPLIDGVFVPDASRAMVQVTREGHVFGGCPKTCNVFFSELLACSTKHKGTVAGQKRGMVLAGQEYGVPTRPGIFMHANLGVTFDLGAVREMLGTQVNIERFESVAGISEQANDAQLGDLDIWILIDGREVDSRQNVKVGQLQQLDVDLSAEARYLTLMVTDSHSRNPGLVDTFADWCIFGEPRLVLAPPVGTGAH